MHTFRTRFSRDIVTEFLPPMRPTKHIKVIIFCSGLPTAPSHKALLEFYSKKGYWIFSPRYRGTWESSGSFLRLSPHKDVLDVIDELPKGFKSLWDNKIYKLRPEKIFIIGNSFGGPAAILASRDQRVTKAVLIAPVIDWIEVNKVNSRDSKYKFLKEAYGEAYRGTRKEWDKLKSGKFYNPIKHAQEIDGKKLLIFHSKDDEIVPYKTSLEFSKLTGSQLITLKKSGHLSSRISTEPAYYKKIKNFLKN
jgi:dipeptidyl aminopeptidase/acylaminoacyl peptidase